MLFSRLMYAEGTRGIDMADSIRKLDHATIL